MFYLTILFVLCLFFISKTFVIIPARQAGVKERLGKFEGVLKPGLHFLIPFFDKVAYHHEIREQVIEVPPQSCICKDNIQIDVDGIVYIKVIDARLASYGIGNYRKAAINLAQTTMRSEIGKLSLHQLFSEREELNKKVVEEIDKASQPWGIKVLRYELMNILPPSQVVHTLERAMEAERDRRAEVTLATAEKEAVTAISEGKRQAAINLSEGRKQMQINEAEGKAEEIRLLAEAMAFGIKRVSLAIESKGGKKAVDMRITTQFIEEFGKILDKSQVAVVPKEFANIKAIFQGVSQVTSKFGQFQ